METKFWQHLQFEGMTLKIASPSVIFTHPERCLPSQKKLSAMIYKYSSQQKQYLQYM